MKEQGRRADAARHNYGGYKPQFFFRTTNVTGEMQLPDGIEMVMPGDNATMVSGQPGQAGSPRHQEYSRSGKAVRRSWVRVASLPDVDNPM